MKRWFKRFFWAFIMVMVVGAAGYVGLPYLNRYQKTGELTLPGLQDAVMVKRDEKGMAYIYASQMSDALMAQGFVMAQDRLFQMHLTRLMAQGRISELAGSKAMGLDVRMRTLGLHRMARKHADLLDEESRAFFQSFANGVNAFMAVCPKDLHLEFKLAGLSPEPWSIVDSLSVLYYMGYTTSANLQSEIVAQALVDKVGLERATEIFPLNIHPDDPSETEDRLIPHQTASMSLFEIVDRPSLGEAIPFGLSSGIGSNNWVVAPPLSPTGKPILAGDPHLDPRILPGVWYPCGVITQDVRFVGATVPGLPGMALGRTEHIALSMTNNYGDMQDLYVETVDPENPLNYLEGDTSIPFDIIEETLRIKDKSAPEGYRNETFQIRYTRRGPVVSDVLPGLQTQKTLTLRWAPAETMGPRVGLPEMLKAKGTGDLHEALVNLNMLSLNWVFADTRGNIGFRASGRVPVRSQGDGLLPFVVTDETDNWEGWIEASLMPASDNPERGWLGTCNHKVVPHDYPFYYSSFFAPSYRYRRLMELMDRPGPKPVDAHWQFQRDTRNLMAQDIAPIMAQSLMAHEDTREMGKILAEWDFMDEPHLAGPLIFQATYLHFARLVFEDDLGAQLTRLMLSNWYFWQERLHQMVLSGASPWFDDQQTPERVESLKDLFHRAARKTKAQWIPILGEDPSTWEWGRIHTLELVNPIRREGFGKEWLGTGPMPMGGSGETLYRGWYAFEDPFAVTNCASLRMVVDLADEDKVVAVMPGGITGRVFSPHEKDQVEAFMQGRKAYWWFSDREIEENARHSLALTP